MQTNIHETDLQILPETESEKAKIMQFLKSKGCYCLAHLYSDTKGQSWYGKKFIEVAFRADLKTDLETYMEEN